MRFFCERCTCEDPKYFVWLNNQAQCRRCIGFFGQDTHQDDVEGEFQLALPFALTLEQKRLSKQIADVIQRQDVLVYAVCGAGKTELMYETIEQCLRLNQTIALAVARRQVVLQLQARLQAVYPQLSVVAVCEGHTDLLHGHILIVTTHQLFRFHQRLDVLILDEPDAFPYCQEPVLQGFAKQAVRGHTIYLTATPSHDLLVRARRQELIQLELMVRPHGHPLPLPQLIRLPLLVQIGWIKHWLKRHTSPVLIFVPTKRLAKQLSFVLRVPYVHAGHPELDQRIQKFKQQSPRALISTTVLERGVTFDGIDVVVLAADHRVFNEASLTQMAGRVGRSPRHPTGEVYFLCLSQTSSIQACRQALIHANRSAGFVSNPGIHNAA